LSDGILLGALDGSNPLAFLAALGTLRLVHLSAQCPEPRMCWERSGGFWRPKLVGLGKDENGLIEILGRSLWAPVEHFGPLGKNITAPSETFAKFIQQAYGTAERKDRRTADFAAAFGCEVCEDRKRKRIKHTDLCFITGSGHQDFLGTMSTLAEEVTSEDLRDALFGEWRKEKSPSMSMRWDPLDAAEYALQWDNPSGQGAWTVRGANRLAVEALPYFPTMPVKGGLQTTGFRRRSGEDEFTWPVWTQPVTFDTVRSLVSLAELQEDVPPRGVLGAMGIEDVYRAERVQIGQGKNCKVNFRTARAV
jgi:hypothetical protein